MSENLPYHDEQWDDLPLPNEEEAWQKMQLLLEEKKRRRRLLPFWAWRYGVLGMLVAGMAAGGYFLLNRKGQASAGITATNASVHPQEKDQQPVLQHAPEKNKVSLRVAKGTAAASKTSDRNTAQPLAIKEEEPGSDKQRLPKGRVNKAQDFFTRTSSPQKNSVLVYAVPDQKRQNVGKPSSKISADSVAQEKGLESGGEGTVQPGAVLHKDSITEKDSANLAATTRADSSKTQNQVLKNKSAVVFSAGIGLQQAIAFGGQQTSSFNLNGKQNKFSDHIPSAYLRLQKGQWFLQGELHYNTPQPVKPFAFSEVTSYDGANKLLRTERLSIQKLYYHQFPLSINYFVRPRWSVGAGVVYNRFAGAVTGQETQSRNVLTGGESVTTEVVPVKGYKDSFLYKSTTGLVLQTDYHWGRFSLGLRYTTYLQPFIKYTLPNGTVLNEKNQVLQASLRFRLF